MRVIIIALLAASAWGQTTVSDTIKVAPGNSTFSGEIEISAPDMVFNSTSYARWRQTYTITAGVLSVVLIPNDAATPTGTVYTVEFRPSNQAPKWTETWRVPTSGSAVNHRTVKVTTNVAPAAIAELPLAQLGKTGVDVGKCIGNVNGVWSGVVCSGAGASSFNGRTGDVVPLVGDYSAFFKAIDNVTLIADVPGLQSALDGKSASNHSHAGTYAEFSHVHIISGVTGLQTALDGKVSLAGSYSNPDWLTGLAWTRITGTEAIMGITTGVGAPVSTPVKVGDVYSDLDSDPHVTYIADCTTTAGCWRSIGSGGSGTTTANYLQSFTSQTSVALTHSAGTDGIVAQCFDGSGQEIGYNTLIKTSTSTATVTFTTAQTGACVVNSSGGGGSGGGGGDTTAVVNSGAGAQVLKTSTNVTARTLVAGSNVTVTQGTDTITIAATGGGGGSITAGTTLTESSGTYNVNGSVIPMYISGTSSLTYTSIANGACGNQTFTLAGALNGDSIAPGWPASISAGFSGTMFVSAANTITVRLCNHSGGSVTPTAGLTYKAMILRGF